MSSSAFETLPVYIYNEMNKWFRYIFENPGRLLDINDISVLTFVEKYMKALETLIFDHLS